MGRILLALVFLSSFASTKEYLIKWKSTHDFQRQLHPLSAASKLTKVEIADLHIVANLRADSRIEYISENKKISATENISVPNANRYQWALEKIRATAAWQAANSLGSRAVVIAILDTGIDLTHESLAPNIVSGYDFKDDDADPSDEAGIFNPGHGTHCAGIAAATGKVANGVAGAGPELSLMPLRILGKNGSGEIGNAVRAIDYAIEHGAKVISASWGGEMTVDEAWPLIEAIKRADDAGIIFVTSAGNGGDDGLGYDIDHSAYYPAAANFPNTITVGASDENDRAANFSNYGEEKVQLSAPGMQILSTLPQNQYDVLSGTSMSAPLVAGLAAYLTSLNPDLRAADVRALLQSSGVAIDAKTACHCRVDAKAAVDVLVGHQSFLVPNSATLKIGETMRFRIFSSTATNYKSSDENIAHIDGDGTLTALRAGEVQVLATDAAKNSLRSGVIHVR